MARVLGRLFAYPKVSTYANWIRQQIQQAVARARAWIETSRSPHRACDLIATVEGESPARLDAALDRIGKIHGVARTVSSIVLPVKFSR